MRLPRLALALLLPGAWALSRRDQFGPVKNVTLQAPKKFIVEVAPGVDLDELADRIDTVSTAKVVRKFKSDIFTGLSLESDRENIDTLERFAQFVKAWPAARIQLDPHVPTQSFSDDAAAANYSVHKYTGVDKLHEDGIYGKGAVVAVVDTGTWYKHPALGGGFGLGFKVAGGYDLVGDADWPNGSPKAPDNDPQDNLGHGTHVAGIIAGKSDWYTGVAPEATLLSYKVFSTVDSTDEDTLIDAFLMAYDAGADIITSSIGGLSGFPDGPWALVASRLVDQGVIVTISAGNNGEDGVFFGSNGSSGKNVLAVASMDPGTIAALPFEGTFSLNGQVNTSSLGYFPAGNPWRVEGLPIIPISNNTSILDEACNPLPANTPDLANAIALVRRGTCNFAVKQANLEAFGAKYVLVYTNENPITTPSTTDFDSELGLIEAKAGEAIIATIAAGGNVTVTFSDEGDRLVGVFNSAGGIPSEYTSWGGTYDLELKPDVAAPGRNILSTYLENSYAVLSGTSMACPYVAGVAALYVGKYGGRSVHGPAAARMVADRIRSSGAAIPWQVEQPAGLPVDYGFWAPVPQVGTGLISAVKVLNYTTSLRFEPFALNDTAHFSRYHKVDITNGGTKPVTYTFSLQPAGGLDTQSVIPSYLVYFLEMKPRAIVPKVSFPSGTFTVEPGETRTAQFNFAQPEGLDPKTLPLYSGKVLISGSNGEEFSVPYMGLGFSLKDEMRRAMFSDSSPRQMGGPNRDDIDIFHSYDFNLSWLIQDFPKVQVELKWGARELRWDFYEAGWKESHWQYPPVVGENGYIGSAAYWESSGSYWAFDPTTMDKEKTLPFPVVNTPRTSVWSFGEYSFWWFGKLANGSYISPGNYT
ncbi:uncharacterized protein E0L32_008927 [Thyridium curvatum]|uniref:Minor extracellular protease vpr n=1 Tax=Thyridium curvatum TaxID=1093900 RepID=A0A507AIE1_9PEZI|nr:uncharacterized protein E0L32_008927 [Thyridium curvatum]TPX09905.1 hypothetical protein E0L32_008927 [Thyridium curvatum]